MSDLTLWVARDADGDLYCFNQKPNWDEDNGVWEPSKDSALLDMDMTWLNEIKPGECFTLRPIIYGYERHATKGL